MGYDPVFNYNLKDTSINIILITAIQLHNTKYQSQTIVINY